MTTTRLDPKVIIVEPKKTPEDRGSSKTEVCSPAPSQYKSGYVKTESDPWKAMTTPSDIGDMVDAWNDIEEQSSYRGPIDALSESMVINDPVATNKLLGKRQIPDVPDLHKDLFKNNPKLMEDMKPVVERYEALVKTFDQLLKNAYFALKQPMSSLEIQATQKDIEALKRGRLAATKAFQEAQYYFDVQKFNEKTEREAKKAERDAAIEKWS